MTGLYAIARVASSLVRTATTSSFPALTFKSYIWVGKNMAKESRMLYTMPIKKNMLYTSINRILRILIEWW